MIVRIGGIVVGCLFVAMALEWVPWWTFGAAVIAVAGLAFWTRRRQFWNEPRPHQKPVAFLDVQMAVRPTILKHTPPVGYRLACLYFGTGLIDRTSVLDHGFPVRIFDRIPALASEPRPFASIVDDRAREIVAAARRSNRPIHLLWSGGIDSTLACIAIKRALGDDTERLVVFHNAASRAEYPRFFAEHLKKRIALRKLRSVADAYTGNALVVTGELGDQLFGSAKALDVPHRTPLTPLAPAFPGQLRQPWTDALPRLLSERLASPLRADLVVDYLRPQIERAPVAVGDLFTCLWWLNFSCKWQAVSLRMMSGIPSLGLREFQAATHHFFQTVPFQQWALAHPGEGVRDSWSTYKWAARDYILAFTSDGDFHADKEKVPSLKGLIRPGLNNAALAIDEAGHRLWQPRDLSLRQALASEGGSSSGTDGSSGISIEFSYARETPLWDDMSSGE